MRQTRACLAQVAGRQRRGRATAAAAPPAELLKQVVALAQVESPTKAAHLGLMHVAPKWCETVGRFPENRTRHEYMTLLQEDPIIIAEIASQKQQPEELPPAPVSGYSPRRAQPSATRQQQVAAPKKAARPKKESTPKPPEKQQQQQQQSAKKKAPRARPGARPTPSAEPAAASQPPSQIPAATAEHPAARMRALWESQHACFKRDVAGLGALNAHIKESLQRYLVLDVETTIIGSKKRTANPFDEGNRVVYAGFAHHADKGAPKVVGPFAQRGEWRCPDLSDVSVLVGHNIKFDLLYFWEQPELKRFLANGGLVWDTMYAEYLLRGHREGSVSLDNVSLHYGLPLKDSFISDQWRKGVNTPDIDPDRMREYNAADVANTLAIFYEQVRMFADGVRLPMVMAHMDSVLATTEMEWNGLFIDKPTLEKMLSAARNREVVIQRQLAERQPPEMAKLAADSPGLHFAVNWESPTALRTVLFGGKLKVVGEVRESAGTVPEPPAGKKKSTKRSMTREVEFAPMAPADWMLRNGNFCSEAGQWASGAEVLESLVECDEPKLAELAKLILELRTIRKVVATYLLNFEDLADSRGLVHHELRHTLTRTGRLNSMNPNMQNVPREGTHSAYPVKKSMRSRFGEQGLVIEADYGQLEVVVLALLSQDRNLITALDAGYDLHCRRLMLKEGVDYETVVQLCKVDKNPEWVAKRRQAKAFQFQRQYGAGKTAIAAATGLSIAEVERLIAAEEAEYPEVSGFTRRVYACLQDTLGTVPGDPDLAYYDGLSGNRWYFMQEFDKFSRRGGGVEKRFKHQLVLNHPVQGFAAEVVHTCLGRLWRHFAACDNYGGRAFLVNTVHDSVWIDAKAEVAPQVTADLERIMCGVQEALGPVGAAVKLFPRFRCDTMQGPSFAELRSV
eukprot:TRINITY_DN3662_c6_g1_i1.p1 TRINITY_DN3662_c6_g1~~TRINITY_DN3662_c6_g1_i1.p1  ORF type:complete len:907 (+),score=310.80 TRINITY_DN3662_c6_g1_i1:100-2820(+)